MENKTECPLCNIQSKKSVWSNSVCHVVTVDDPDFPGFCRVIAANHVTEMTDLIYHERMLLMEVVLAVETFIRNTMKPHKINLASLGNITPHLHWHIIPRWKTDSRFPHPIWTLPHRQTNVPTIKNIQEFEENLKNFLTKTLPASSLTSPY